MKIRFNTFDIICTVTELQKYVGMRVNNIYDIDNKTYLIRLQRSEEKCTILLESANRFHITAFEWPKNQAPSSFSMKLRKHLRNKRLESLKQLGNDRVVDLQFGTGEATYHVILELYDKGNIILTDFEYTILNLLRPHAEGDRFKFVVREKYPENRARDGEILNLESIREILAKAKPGDQLKKVLVSNTEYGPPVIEHVLTQNGLSVNAKVGKSFDVEANLPKLMVALESAEVLFVEAKQKPSKGYMIQKREERIQSAENAEEKTYYYSNQEFHPLLFVQHLNLPYKEFDSFTQAVDEFYSSLESQKLELRALQQERDALKKLENVKKDHSQRLEVLEKTKEVDKQKAELITRNEQVVNDAIRAIQGALASQISWTDLEGLVKDAANRGDEVAACIKALKLKTNHISLHLSDPYDEEDEEARIPAMIIDVDLSLSAFANGRKYYDLKRFAAKKQQKTLESQSKAFKSAEKKTKQALKDVQTITNIIKARKVYWFEKFFWFISSENYLIIAGRDQQQNEMIVKRYLRLRDVYVHADIHGASSVIIKNPLGGDVPPKTLNEAGTMAICYSVAWDAKVVTNAYWVWADQVSKTAPTGEYLTTGSFMVRGKKNFLPQSHLILGLSFLFKLEDGSVERHKDERRIITVGEEESTEVELKEEEEVVIDESDDDEEKEEKVKNEKKLDKIEEKVLEEDEEDTVSAFPDTQIRIQHLDDTKINIITESPNQVESDSDSEKVVYLGDDKPVVLKPSQRFRGNSESSQKFKKQEPITETKSETTIQNNQTKRGQKSKLKKIKEKYKDQDEEERKLRMEILQSDGKPKENKKTKKKSQEKKVRLEPRQPKPKPVMTPSTDDQQGQPEDDQEEPVVQDEIDIINTLTGIPNVEDELLFAVPVIAPYNTLSSYKYKVKLTPGTARKGKAAKTAVNMFLKDRNCTPREKDLLKAVKDDQMARNFPGKVKLSAPKLQNLRK